MFKQAILNHAICIASALAFVVAIVRPVTSAGCSSRPSCLYHAFTPQSTHSTRTTALKSPTARVKALPSEGEEQLNRTAASTRFVLEATPADVVLPAFGATLPPTFRASPPLRC